MPAAFLRRCLCIFKILEKPAGILSTPLEGGMLLLILFYNVDLRLSDLDNMDSRLMVVL